MPSVSNPQYAAESGNITDDVLAATRVVLGSHHACEWNHSRGVQDEQFIKASFKLGSQAIHEFCLLVYDSSSMFALWNKLQIGNNA